MKLLLLLAFCCVSVPAQTLSFAIHDLTGAVPDTSLPAAYQFADTAQGSASTIVVQLTNSGSSAVKVIAVYAGATAGSSAPTSNFTVTNQFLGAVIAPSPKSAQLFAVNFTPPAVGQFSAYLQIAYTVQQSTCNFNGENPKLAACPSTIAPVSTLSGTGTAAALLLTYSTGQGSNPLQPSATPLNFGNVSVSSTQSITFTLTNQTASAVITPAISLQTEVFVPSAFALNTSSVPANIPGSGTATFTVTFSPSTTNLLTATLLVGANQYNLTGTGTVVTNIDQLAIYYVDPTQEIRTQPQAATPIDFGQLVPGTAGSVSFNFTVTNPQTSFDAVTLSTLSVSGAAFSLTGAPSLPVTIQPNSSITFTVVFSASTSGAFTGTLSIGGRHFNLTGLAVVSPVPAMSFQLSQQPLTSQQQVTLTIDAATPSQGDHPGQLTMTFSPSVTNVSDDPAVVFLATGGRELSVNIAKGSQNVTSNGQSALLFQTGTTAGTLTFTLTFVNTPPLTQSFTITPSKIYLSGGQAVRQSPNLVVTLDGYDNTYSAGQLAFTFFDSKGKALNSTPMAVDATSSFHQYFFTGNSAGGAFALQASFPVTGDVTQIGSVAVTMTNSAGQTTTNLSFQ